MALDPSKLSVKLIQAFDPLGKEGGLLLFLNAAGMLFAGIANTFAIATDKNTSKEDKKTLVPAGIATGAANLILYYTLTKKVLIKSFEKGAEKYIGSLSESDLASKALDFVKNKISKAENGGLFGIGKKSNEFISSMKQTLLQEGKPTEYALGVYKENLKGGAGVLGAFAGAIIGCAIITPIIRDVSAYFVQKRMEAKNPSLKDKPYRPYFDPSHLKVNYHGQKQPLSMKNYMAFTSGNMKV